jgi:hypothetical protein
VPDCRHLGRSAGERRHNADRSRRVTIDGQAGISATAAMKLRILNYFIAASAWPPALGAGKLWFTLFAEGGDALLVVLRLAQLLVSVTFDLKARAEA